MKKFFIFVSLLLGLAGAFFVTAPAPSRECSAESYVDEETGKTIIDTNYWFRNVTVEIDVRRDKTMAITEKLTVGFIKGGVNTDIIRARRSRAAQTAFPPSRRSP